MWYTVKDGNRVANRERRTFLGTGPSLRDAKIAAAKAAIALFDLLMPGTILDALFFSHCFVDCLENCLAAALCARDEISQRRDAGRLVGVD